jgi:hypothetical protein
MSPGIGSRALSKSQQADGGRVKRKAARRAAASTAERQCYADVDKRDGRRCRVCGRQARPGVASMLDRLHHHHMILRSRGGQHEPSSVISLCAGCHSEIHVDCTLRLSGDANLRSAETGQLCGVRVERFGDGGWRLIKWV